MRRLLTACAALALISGLLVASVPAAAQASTSSPQAVPSVTDGWRLRMLIRVNAARVEAGAPALRICPTLNRVAGSRARAMAATNSFGHLDARGRGPGDRMTDGGYRWTRAGENIAAGQPRVYEAVRAWRRSPSHLATMTDPRFTHVGFGFARDDDGRYRTIWVQNYGTGGRC